MKTALTGARIFDGTRFIEDSALVIDDTTVHGVVAQSQLPEGCLETHLNGGVLTPGFIDLQINGGGGVLFNNDPSEATLKTMTDALASYGVTRLMPTLITDTAELTRQAVAAARAAEQSNPGVLGIHVEGPFFSTLKNGVHRRDRIRTLTDADWSWLDSMSQIPAILTLAPEQVDNDDIRRIAALGIRVCAGHTNATYDEVLRAHDAGQSGFTHLFNAMRPMTGREPGVVGAAFALSDTWAGLITDGIHVHPGSIRIALQNKGYEKIFLVSDAMATVGSRQKSFELYGERIEEQDGRLVNQEGRLAGSAITLLDGIHYCIRTLGLPVEQVLAMATRVPAEYMNLAHRLGKLQPGRAADVCHLDDNYEIQAVWRNGEPIFNTQEASK